MIRSSATGSSVYDLYTWREEYKSYPLTYGGFAIVAGPKVEDRSSILVTQRNGKGGSKWLWNLPGGGKQPEDSCLKDAAVRELAEEVGITVSADEGVPIGDPLWLPVKKDGAIVRVDCAQAFLFEAGAQIPQLMPESVALAFVHEDSLFHGFKVVGLEPDPAKRSFGRTPIMMWDGLSILQVPFYEGPVSDEILIPGCRNHREDFFLLDGGRVIGRYNSVTDSMKLWNRLNPFEETGRFPSELHKLA